MPRGNYPRQPRLSHDQRILLMALASALPGAMISLIFLWWIGDYTPKVQWTLSVLIVTFCLGFAFALRERVVLPCKHCPICSRRWARVTSPSAREVREAAIRSAR